MRGGGKGRVGGRGGIYAVEREYLNNFLDVNHKNGCRAAWLGVHPAVFQVSFFSKVAPIV